MLEGVWFSGPDTKKDRYFFCGFPYIDKFNAHYTKHVEELRGVIFTFTVRPISLVNFCKVSITNILFG